MGTSQINYRQGIGGGPTVTHGEEESLSMHLIRRNLLLLLLFLRDFAGKDVRGASSLLLRRQIPVDIAESVVCFADFMFLPRPLVIKTRRGGSTVSPVWLILGRRRRSRRRSASRREQMCDLIEFRPVIA